MRSLLLASMSLLAGLGLVRGSACNGTGLVFGEPVEEVTRKINCLVGLEESMLEMRGKFPMDCCTISAFKKVCKQNGNDRKRLDKLAGESVFHYTNQVYDQLLSSKDGCSSKASSHCCYPEKQLRGVKLATGREVHLSASATGLGTKGVSELFRNVLMCMEGIVFRAMVADLKEVPQICCDLPIISLFCQKPGEPTKKPTRKPTTSSRPTSVLSGGKSQR